MADGKLTHKDLGGDGFEAINKDAVEYLANLKSIVEMSAKLASGKLETSVKGASESLKVAATNSNKLISAQTQLVALEKAAAQELAKTKVQIQLKNKELKAQATAELNAGTAIAKGNAALKLTIKTKADAKAQTAILRASVDQLDTTTKKGTTTEKIYNAQIDKNTAFINENSDSQSKAKQNVGNYTESIIAAITALEKEGLALKKTESFQKAMIASGSLTAANQDKVQKELQETTTKLDGVNAKLKQYGAQAQASANSSDKFKSGVLSTAKQIVGFTGVAALATAAIRKIATSFKEAREDVLLFEEEFTNVLTLLDESQKAEFKGVLEDGAINVMAKYGLAIEDVNKSLFDTISAGVPAGEAIEFLNNASGVAIAGNAELSDVISGTTTVMNAYGDAAGDTKAIMNALFAAQVDGKTTVGELGQNIGKVAGIAAKAGIPFNELATTLAGVTKFSDGTKESTTGLTSIISALIKPSDEARKAFASMNIEVGASAVENDGLLNKLLEVAGAYDENHDMLSELIPNIQALKSISGLTSESIAELKQNTLDLNDADASSITVQKALEEQMGTRASQSKRLEAAKAALNIERDKEYSKTKGLVSALREARIASKLRRVEDKQAAVVSNELKEAVIAEMDEVRNATGEFITYAEALERVERAKIASGDIKFEAYDDPSNDQDQGGDDIVADTKKNEDDIVDIKKDAAIRAGEIAQQAYQDDLDLQISIANNAQQTAKNLSDAKLKIIQDELADKRLLYEGYDEDELKEEEKHLADINKMIQDGKEADKKNEKEAKEEEAAETEFFDQVKEESAKIAANQFNSRIDNNLAKFESAQDAKQEVLDAQLDNGLISEEEYAEKTAAIDLETRQEQAKAARKESLFQIALNTAVAISKVLGQTGIFGLAAWIPVAALGAIQAATVMATPIPAYEKGGVSKGGDFIAGEAGSELMVSPDGSVALSASTATLYKDVPKDTAIIPNDITNRILGSAKGQALVSLQNKSSENGAAMYKELLLETKGMRRDMRNKKSVSSGISEKGFYKAEVSAQNRINRVKKFRI